jgi:hypothetical protein
MNMGREVDQLTVNPDGSCVAIPNQADLITVGVVPGLATLLLLGLGLGLTSRRRLA